jgi:hypothetical protein
MKKLYFQIVSFDGQIWGTNEEVPFHTSYKKALTEFNETVTHFQEIDNETPMAVAILQYTNIKDLPIQGSVIKQNENWALMCNGLTSVTHHSSPVASFDY